jgi:hypothetical protein
VVLEEVRRLDGVVVDAEDDHVFDVHVDLLGRLIDLGVIEVALQRPHAGLHHKAVAVVRRIIQELDTGKLLQIGSAGGNAAEKKKEPARHDSISSERSTARAECVSAPTLM